MLKIYVATTTETMLFSNVTFGNIIFTRPDFDDFFRSIISVQNCNRFLVYLTIYRPIEI